MNTKKAFQINAVVDGKSWLTRYTVLTAPNIEEAIKKATDVLKLTPEHKTTVEPVTVFSTDAKLQTNNYPCGRERATAFFSVEYSTKKGMRTTFQTINPKNGRLNNPKHSTYSRVILPMQLQNGHFDFCGYLDFNGTESINKGLHFMADFHELFTEEQIKDIALYCIAMEKVNAKAMVIYAGSSFDDIKPLIQSSVDTLVKIANTGVNLWESAKLDEDAIEATKKPDYNPFKITSYVNQ